MKLALGILGGRLEERLESGRDSTLRTRGSSSEADSSSDDGESGRRIGGNLSPNPIVRVGGGGSFAFPRSLRSPTGEMISTGASVLLCGSDRRAGSRGVEDGMLGTPSGVTRRDGSGGLTGWVGVAAAELVKEESWVGKGVDKPFGRRGGRGGACGAGRGGGFGLEGDEKLERLSLELPEGCRSW